MFYIYDQETKVFTHATIGQPNPRVQDAYLTPPNSTTKAPPRVGAFEAAVFVDDAWILVADYTSVSYWEKETGSKIQLPLGVFPTDALVDIEPPNDAVWDDVNDAWKQDPEIIKQRELAALRSRFATESSVPVMSQSFYWVGGIESAQRITNKADLLEYRNQSQGIIHDIDSVPHTLSRMQIRDIGSDIALAYERKFETYQAAKRLIITR